MEDDFISGDQTTSRPSIDSVSQQSSFSWDNVLGGITQAANIGGKIYGAVNSGKTSPGQAVVSTSQTTTTPPNTSIVNGGTPDKAMKDKYWMYGAGALMAFLVAFLIFRRK